MLKSISAIAVAATIAAVFAVLSAPAPVDAGPIAKPVETAMTECANRPWPYLRCVGTQFGSRHVRLVTSERLGAN